jgi:phosphotransacetylase
MNEKKEKKDKKIYGRTRSYSTTRRVVGRHISTRNGTLMMRAQPMMELPPSTSVSSPSIHVLWTRRAKRR